MKQLSYVLLILWLSVPLLAQEAYVAEDKQARDDARRLERLFRQIGNKKFAAGSIGKNHDSVKEAFADAVKLARRSTVIVKVNGRRKSLGTVVDDDGYILTKASELSPGKLTCQLAGREVVPAKLIGLVSSHDLAMLKIDRKDLVSVRWNNLSLPEIGSWLATCNLTHEPLAVGVVSVGARPIRREHSVLGIEMQQGGTNPIVTNVMEGSGAAEAGLQIDDLILSVNGKRVQTQFSLQTTIRGYRPGDSVRIGLQRGEEEVEVRAKLGRIDDFDPSVIEFQSFVGSKLSVRRSGFPSAIQHDTVLLPNQCGGPVVDLDGRFVGINIARADRTASYLVPAVSIRPLIKDLKARHSSAKNSLDVKRINELCADGRLQWSCAQRRIGSHQSHLILGSAMPTRLSTRTLLLATALTIASQFAVAAPNIVLVLVDDLGWADLGCQGSEFYETPNIDRLAAGGMRFTDAYAACAVCSPTRAAVMTGRYPARVGVTDWIRARFQGGKLPADGKNPTQYVGGPKQKLLCPPNPFWMESEEVTIAERLQAAGYATCHIGKWHLGMDDWYPEKQGFDLNFGGCDYGQPPSYFDPYSNNRLADIPTLKPRKAGEYLSDREADEAVAFIHEHKDEPFFLYLANYAVHTPIQAKPDVAAKYAAKAKSTKQTKRQVCRDGGKR